MAEKAHDERSPFPSPRPDGSTETARTAQVSADKFTLRAMLERQFAEFEGGPTMDDIAAKADRLRSGGVRREGIAADFRAEREDRAS